MGFGLLGIYMYENKYYYTESKTELLKEIKTFFKDFTDIPDHGFIFVGPKFYEFEMGLEALHYGHVAEEIVELINSF